MSFAACDERCARLRTSDATTAKPRPASPARAASTAALSASRLVWRAISSITEMMSEILREEFLDPRHRRDRLAPPPRRRGRRLRGCSRISSLACCAFSAFFFTVAEISSIEAEVSSRLAACSSVRCDRSVVLDEISAAAFETSRVETSDALHRVLQLVDGAVEVVLDLLVFGGEFLRHAIGQVAASKVFKSLPELRNHIGDDLRGLGLAPGTLFALGLFAPCDLGLLLGFEPHLFGELHLELVDRARDAADLVLAADAWQDHVEVSGREFAHAAGELAQRPDHGEEHEHGAYRSARGSRVPASSSLTCSAKSISSTKCWFSVLPSARAVSTATVESFSISAANGSVRSRAIVIACRLSPAARSISPFASATIASERTARDLLRTGGIVCDHGLQPHRILTGPAGRANVRERALHVGLGALASRIR